MTGLCTMRPQAHQRLPRSRMCWRSCTGLPSPGKCCHTRQAVLCSFHAALAQGLACLILIPTRLLTGLRSLQICSQADRHMLANRQPFVAAAEQHLAALAAQVLASQRVVDVATWCPIVTCLALGAAAAVSPTAMAAQGNQDPSHYIKVQSSGALQLFMELLYAWLAAERFLLVICQQLVA